MRKIYTEKQIEWLKANCKGVYMPTLTGRFNRRFKTKLVPRQMRALLANHKIRTGYKRREFPHLFPPKIDAFMRKSVQGRTCQELAALVNGKFAADFTASQVKGWQNRNKVRSGVDAKFKKGHVPANKGKKGVCAKGCEKTWFKKGHAPFNQVRVRTEVVTTDGYVKVKIAEPNKWRFKHVMAWEKKNGPVPKGMALVFLDGDKLNCKVGNLALVSRGELAVINHLKLLTKGNAELSKAGSAVAKIKSRLAALKSKRSSK